MAERRYPLGPRDLARVFTPFHNVSYYAPEIKAFVDAGMRGSWMAYFAYRAAPMGAVPAEVVMATFYFARMIQRAIPEVWSVMSPGAAIALRDHCVDQALRRLLADRLDDAALAEGAQLMRASIEGCAPGAGALRRPHRPALATRAAPHGVARQHVVARTPRRQPQPSPGRGGSRWRASAYPHGGSRARHEGNHSSPARLDARRVGGRGGPPGRTGLAPSQRDVH